MTPLFRCDVCQFVHEKVEEAAACEALGTPEPPPWLKVGDPIVGFGENGAVTGVVNFISVEHVDYGGHGLVVRVSGVYLSHNQDDDMFNVGCFDPMYGYDYLRYVEPKSCAAEAATWVRVCRERGVEPDPTKARWFQYKGEEKRAAFLAGVAEALAGE